MCLKQILNFPWATREKVSFAIFYFAEKKAFFSEPACKSLKAGDLEKEEAISGQIARGLQIWRKNLGCLDGLEK